jgi:hypothetical protein
MKAVTLKVFVFKVIRLSDEPIISTLLSAKSAITQLMRSNQVARFVYCPRPSRST